MQRSFQLPVPSFQFPDSGAFFAVCRGRRLARGHSRPRAFTLVELLIVLAMTGIIVGLVLPTLGDSRMLRLRAAARMLAADLEFAQSESIAHPDNLRLVKFDTSTTPHRYWVAASSAPDTPLADPSNQQPLLNVFGSGRASGTGGVMLQSVNVGGAGVLKFDAYGSPDQTTDATVQLSIQVGSGTQTLTVRAKAGSGEVSVE
jgi:prepilin-type N-terminal cleavage/methylation domain-containing protein